MITPQILSVYHRRAQEEVSGQWHSNNKKDLPGLRAAARLEMLVEKRPLQLPSGTRDFSQGLALRLSELFLSKLDAVLSEYEVGNFFEINLGRC